MKLLDDLITKLSKAPSLAAVAKEAGLSEKTLRRIRDRHNSPRLETVDRIMSALDATSKRKS